MKFIIQVNENEYLRINTNSKYYIIDLVHNIDLSTVFNTIQEATSTYYRYLDDMRNIIKEDDNIYIREVNICPTDSCVGIPNLMDY